MLRTTNWSDTAYTTRPGKSAINANIMIMRYLSREPKR